MKSKLLTLVVTVGITLVLSTFSYGYKSARIYHKNLNGIYTAGNTCFIDSVFNVYPERKIYKVGEKVNFKFAGNAKEINYFSGEQGSIYKYRNVNQTGSVKVNMSFQSLAKGEATRNTLRIFASTSFYGFNDEGLIDPKVLVNSSKKTWVDITDRFVIPYTNTEKYVNSNNADISDLAEDKKQVVFAFKFLNKGDKKVPVSYVIKNLNIENEAKDGKKSTLLNFLMRSSWIPVDVKNSESIWSQSVRVPLVGITGSLGESEDWLISAPINLNEIKPDKPEIVKRFQDKVPLEISHVYNKPGIYTVSFVYKEADLSKEIVKEFQITIIQ